MKHIFIWDFSIGNILGGLLDWIYTETIAFLGEFFAQISGMGVEIFDLAWVQGIVLFFTYLG